MSEDNRKPTPLSVMVGSGEKFEAQGKTYTVMPMTGAHVAEFFKDELNLGSQLFTLSDSMEREKLNKWLGEVSVETNDGTVITTVYCRNDKGEIMNVDKCFADGWNIKDFRRYLMNLGDISG